MTDKFLNSFLIKNTTEKKTKGFVEKTMEIVKKGKDKTVSLKEVKELAKLFDKEKYEQDSKKWLSYRKPHSDEILSEKRRNLESSRVKLKAVTETIKSNNDNLKNEPAVSTSQSIESVAIQRESSVNVNNHDQPSSSTNSPRSNLLAPENKGVGI
jgi:DNA-binding transcriptional MerR regulator